MDTYPIDQAAQLTGLSAHTLRYYERVGLLEPVGRAASGHRRYTDTDLGWVTFLTLLRATGMTIRDMQDFMATTRAGDHTIPERLQILHHHREQLIAKMAADRDHLERLDTKIAIYQERMDQADAPMVTGTARSG